MTGSIQHQDVLYPTEFLNSLQFPGIPDHHLQLKIGVPVMLLQNINERMGLCNGTRLIVKQIGIKVIEAQIITGYRIGLHVYIPRAKNGTKRWKRREHGHPVSYYVKCS
ncbi:hypothetical protein MKW92_037591 [Papaver armeniacum]|nr:hypothetical protein MKW92_037591 [Papaver armeniacum]